MSALPASGRQYALTAGDARAVVTEVGASLRSLVLGGHQVLDGYGLDEAAFFALDLRVMAFTGDTLPDRARRRRGLGVEPMSCAPNAFRTGEGLVGLAPGTSTESSWGIQLDRQRATGEAT